MLLYIKCNWDGSVAGTHACNVHDLGSSPRSYIFPYYFAITIPMQLQHKSIPYVLQIQVYTRPRDSDQGLRIEEHNIHESTCQHVSKKVHKVRNSNGPEFLGSYLLIWDWHPPWFANLYIFFIFYFQLLFYFLYCFNLINYFLQNIKNA